MHQRSARNRFSWFLALSRRHFSLVHPPPRTHTHRYFQRINAYATAVNAVSKSAADEAIDKAEAASRAAEFDGDGDGEPDSLDDFSGVTIHPMCEDLAATVRTNNITRRLCVAIRKVLWWLWWRCVRVAWRGSGGVRRGVSGSVRECGARRQSCSSLALFV